LKNRTYTDGNIVFGDVVGESPFYTSYLFTYDSDGKKVSGLAHVPANTTQPVPIIIQFRGYMDPTTYTSGGGTIHSSEVFAKNGFLTLAPDFLGYGQSASPSADAMEERFETYTTALNLLASVKNINQSLKNANIPLTANPQKIGIWGHSNGGHIAIATAEITGTDAPVVLWNPVSRTFPYSILYYSDDLPDNGKGLRKLIANFEKDYDIEKYSPSNFLSWINAPIQLHQAIDDEAVPKKWSDDFNKNLKDLGKDITYYTYPGEDHDFHNGSWNTVVERSTEFFQKYLNN
jgi:uncharacterized protein